MTGQKIQLSDCPEMYTKYLLLSPKYIYNLVGSIVLYIGHDRFVIIIITRDDDRLDFFALLDLGVHVLDEVVGVDEQLLRMSRRESVGHLVGTYQSVEGTHLHVRSAHSLQIFEGLQLLKSGEAFAYAANVERNGS